MARRLYARTAQWTSKKPHSLLSLLTMDGLENDLDMTAQGSRTDNSTGRHTCSNSSSSSSSSNRQRRRARLVPTFGEEQVNSSSTCTAAPRLHVYAHTQRAGTRKPDADVHVHVKSSLATKSTGGLFGRIFGLSSRHKTSTTCASANKHSNNDRSSAITQVTAMSSSSFHSCKASVSSLCETSGDGTNTCTSSTCTCTCTCTCMTVDVNDLIEQRRWGVLVPYLKTRAGREEVLMLDLDATVGDQQIHIRAGSHADKKDEDEEHEDENTETNTSRSTRSTMTRAANPLLLAPWGGAPESVVAALLDIRPSLAVHADAFGRAALHVACLTTHLDLDIDNGDDNGSSDDEDDGEDAEANEEDNLGLTFDDGGLQQLALSAQRSAVAQRAQRRRVRRALHRQASQLARRAERDRVMSVLRRLIAADPSMINRPEAEGLCCIEISILCNAAVEVVYLLRKCSEAYWKSLEVQKSTRTLSPMSGKRLVDEVVAAMAQRGMSIGTPIASATTVPDTSTTTTTAKTATNISISEGTTTTAAATDATATAKAITSTTIDQHRHHQPLRRGNSWWRRRKRTVLSDYLSQSFHKQGPLLTGVLVPAEEAVDDDDAKTNTDNKQKTEKPSLVRAWTKYDANPGPNTTPIGSCSIDGNDDDVGRKKSSEMARSNSNGSVASSSSGSSSSGMLPLTEDDRHTYIAGTA